ncbi:MAG: transposase [Spirochaetaceae bacterium]
MRAALRGWFYYLYLIIDVWSRKIVGWSVDEREHSDVAAQLIRHAAHREQVEPGSLVLYSDNGGPMKGATVKNRPEYPTKPFESLEAARDWVKEFVRWYNHEHLHSAIRFVTPEAEHELTEASLWYGTACRPPSVRGCYAPAHARGRLPTGELPRVPSPSSPTSFVARPL